MFTVFPFILYFYIHIRFLEEFCQMLILISSFLPVLQAELWLKAGLCYIGHTLELSGELFQKYRCLGCAHGDSGLIILGWSLSSSCHSTVHSDLRSTGSLITFRKDPVVPSTPDLSPLHLSSPISRRGMEWLCCWRPNWEIHWAASHTLPRARLLPSYRHSQAYLTI